MQEANRILLFTRRLNQLGVRYMVTGSVAAMIYGEPRFTNDVDIVVMMDAAQAARLAEVFPSSEFYCPPLEVIRKEMARPGRGQFNIIHPTSGFKADLYLCGSDSLNLWGLEKARKVAYGGEEIFLSPPEVIIVRKLEFFREGGSEKHLRDIRHMLHVSPASINLPELQEMVLKRGLEEAWSKAQNVAL